MLNMSEVMMKDDVEKGRSQAPHNQALSRHSSTPKKALAYLLYDSASFESAALDTNLTCSAVIIRPPSGRLLRAFLESRSMGVDISVWMFGRRMGGKQMTWKLNWDDMAKLLWKLPLSLLPTAFASLVVVRLIQ